MYPRTVMRISDPVWITNILKVCNDLTFLLEQTDYYLIEVYSQQSDVKFKNDWEQTRFISYVCAQVQSSKKIKPTDIMKFPWDSIASPTSTRKTVSVDRSKRDELIRKMKELIPGSVWQVS
jgi:hypothetical protein